ncbi:Protein-L-isoaspartate O-methyltransferase [Saezia sanguinis]|uniref:Protein-L-isoaspartate O-methyltransferase n=1 Tax=Saezia sanguinis TaxID=1965230 RepID=A0A433SD35_9BURK|nr:protein-L-isoaspartate O-methyltransferase [Saezia sanguinis]RUS66657.1 Protein-L-isoaspartate O-methyltransferase [Saezia sanguinis]
MNVEQARYYMIEQQLRPWLVLDPKLLECIQAVRRELFVPAAYQAMAFADMEIPLRANPTQGEHMLSPKLEGRLLQALSIQPDDRALQIGTGSGYMAAVMAQMGANVLSLELEVELGQMARKSLQKANITEVEVRVTDGSGGAPKEGPYDIILLTGSVAFVPQTFFNQLKPGGRLVAVVGDAPAMTAMLYTRKEESTDTEKPVSMEDIHAQSLFETYIERLRNFDEKPSFTF